MINLYCLKIEKSISSTFGDSMSSKYNESSARKRSAFAWTCLEKILFKHKGLVLNNDLIEYNNHGKPFIKNNPIFFNISHSSDYIVIGISDSDIGVDIERVVSKERADHLIQRFNQEYIDAYNNTSDKQAFFTKCWILMEAYSKMTGTGLSFKLIKDYTSSNNVFFNIVDSSTKETFYYTAINKNNDKVDNIYFEI